MSPMRPAAAWMVLAALTALAAGPAFGQPLDARIGVGAAFVPVTFELEHENSAIAFRFDDSVYGLVFTRAGLHASVYRGNGTAGDREMDLFDINLAIKGELLGDQLEGQWFYVPVMLHSTYRRIRRVEENTEFAAFEYTGIGLGAGLGIRHSFGQIRVLGHAAPGIGLATRSFGTSGGRTTLLDTDLEVRFDGLTDRFGLLVGYGFRLQNWRVGGPDAFDAAGSGKVTYRGSTQALRVGLTW
ncbi:MAG: hypothetical protein HKN29_09925 [Rhodothermales bacterium]|nr:hypothetical protein [Rhodothermales bacterium]